MRALVLSGGGGRGAYELGVYKAFRERGRGFDLISGSSVGAITATAIASGLSMSELEALWARMHTLAVMQPRGDVWRFPLWTYLMHTKPLLKFLEREIDFAAVATSATALRVAAVDVGTGDLRIFTNADVNAKRLLASASIPLLFPMVEDEGHYYWDGGTTMNTPLQPAIAAGADDIGCVLLSPVGARDMTPPRNMWEAIGRFHDLRQLGSLKQDLKHAEFINGLVASGTSDPTWHHIDFDIVSPSDHMGLLSVLNFDARAAKRLITWGHKDGIEFLDGGARDHRVEVQARVEIEEAELRESSPRWVGTLPGTDF